MEVIDDLAQQSAEVDRPSFNHGPITHITLAGSQPFPAPLPLLIDDADMVWPWLAKHHAIGARAQPRALNCFFINDLTVVGHDTSFIHGKMAVGPEMIPAYRALQIQTSHREIVATQLELPLRVIEEPCFSLGADGNVYGHFLLESMARLHIVVKLMRRELGPVKILMVNSLPPWLLSILLEVYDIDPLHIIPYDPTLERVLLKQAIWPSLAVFNDNLHRFNDIVIADLLGSFGGPSPNGIERIFLTRVFFRNPLMVDRALENESELCQIAAREFGFCPLAPETLDWRVQIKLFAGTKQLVGRYGSGLHNAIFLPRGASIGVMRFGNMVQSSISALRSQRMAYITVGNDDNPYSVSTELFRRMLDAVVSHRSVQF